MQYYNYFWCSVNEVRDDNFDSIFNSYLIADSRYYVIAQIWKRDDYMTLGQEFNLTSSDIARIKISAIFFIINEEICQHLSLALFFVPYTLSLIEEINLQKIRNHWLPFYAYRSWRLMKYAQADSLWKMSKMQNQEPARSSFSAPRKREI